MPSAKVEAVSRVWYWQALDGKGDARDQAAAARRHDHRVQVGQLVQDLQADGALPRDDQFVVVGVDEGHTGLGLQLDGVVVGVVVGAGHQAYFRAQALGVFHLHDGRAVGHTDNAADAHPGSRQGHALGVVAGRTGDDPLGPLCLGQLADLVVGAPDFEAAGHLQVFGLEVQPASLGQLRRFDQVGAAGDVLEDKGGVIDFIQCKHNPSRKPRRALGPAASFPLRLFLLIENSIV